LAKAVMSQIELEPIDRLEEKVKLLVGMIDRLRADYARATDDNARLTRDLDAMKARVADADAQAAEVATLREERDVIRSRVGEMLAQIEALEI
jgi:regulator of replication initiation timing